MRIRRKEESLMFKRAALFIATNLAVVVLLGIVLSILQGVFGINLGNNGGLLVMALVFGFGGSFISLMMSKWVAKRGTGAQVIEQPRTEGEQWLVSTVRRQAEAAGIAMPEVAIYDAPEINAFATGPSRNNSLVAVSTGLLQQMGRNEAEAVLAHEVSHVANGDMVTMALIQGVLNTFVIVLARLVGRVIDSYLSGNREIGDQRLRHRAQSQQLAGRGVDRPAAADGPQRSRGRPGARGQPRGQWRHGDDGADPGRAQHVRDRARAAGRPRDRQLPQWQPRDRRSTPSPPGPVATTRWSRCRPACCSRWAATKPRPSWRTRSATWPMATW